MCKWLKLFNTPITWLKYWLALQLFSVKNWNILTYNNLSNTFPRGDSSVAFAYCFFFFLKTGTTLAFVYSEGNFLFSEHHRKIIPSGLEKNSSQISNIRILTISWSWALLELRFIIIFKMSFVKILFIKAFNIELWAFNLLYCLFTGPFNCSFWMYLKWLKFN